MKNERKEKYVHEVFESIAGKYDFMNLLMTWGDAAALAEAGYGKNGAGPWRQGAGCLLRHRGR